MFSLFKATREKAIKAMREGYRSGDFAAAVKLYQQLLADDPDDHQSCHDLGVIMLELRRSGEAIQYFERANRIHESGMCWNNLGRACQQAGDHRRAREAYERARSLDPDDPQPWYNLTVCLREMGDVDASFSELGRCAASHPGHPGTQNDLALPHERLGDRPAAYHALGVAVEAEPGYVPARLNLIRMLCDDGRFPEATEHLEQLAAMGAEVEVATQAGEVLIRINGDLFYRGAASAPA